MNRCLPEEATHRAMSHDAMSPSLPTWAGCKTQGTALDSCQATVADSRDQCSERRAPQLTQSYRNPFCFGLMRKKLPGQ